MIVDLKEDKKKEEAIKKAIKILTDADIFVYTERTHEYAPIQEVSKNHADRIVITNIVHLTLRFD